MSATEVCPKCEGKQYKCYCPGCGSYWKLEPNTVPIRNCGHYSCRAELINCPVCNGSGEVQEKEQVNHPAHYNEHPSGVECVEIVEHFNFNLGNAMKYLWRAGLKKNRMEDLKKAAWYVNREIQRKQKEEIVESLTKA